MRVSVIIPLYNAERWIAQCVDSVLSQSYRDLEVLIINDGSTEGSSGAIPRGDDRVYISHFEHKGAAAARNKGLALSTGEFIVFVDADDYLAPDAIRNLVAASDGVDMVCGSFRKFGNFEEDILFGPAKLNISEVAQCVLGNLRNPRSNQILSGCWAKLYKRELAGRFPELKTAEDMVFNFDYLTRCRNVMFLENVIYHNRKRNGSLSTTFDENDRNGLFGFLEGLRYVKRFLLEFYADHEVEAAIDNSKVYHSCLYFMRIANQLGLPMRDTLMRLFP